MWMFLLLHCCILFVLFSSAYFSSIGHEYEFKLNNTLDRLGIAYIGKILNQHFNPDNIHEQSLSETNLFTKYIYIILTTMELPLRTSYLRLPVL